MYWFPHIDLSIIVNPCKYIDHTSYYSSYNGRWVLEEPREKLVIGKHREGFSMMDLKIVVYNQYNQNYQKIETYSY